MPSALAFDVFGTVVDWRGSIVDEGRSRWSSRHPGVDWGAMADAWRRRYEPSMRRVRDGERPWAVLDTLHRESLDELLPEFGLDSMADTERAELNLVWHRLRPWPDARQALARLAERFTLVTLSNGNLDLLEDLVRTGDLPFHRVLSAETFQAYKPDPATYRGAARELRLEPGELMMVAAHRQDLLAARACGLGTAFVWRRQEWGPAGTDEHPEPVFDLVAEDFNDLAAQLLDREG